MAAEPKNDYYVYVYIDPRNFEEFYYGKGRGSRKNAQLFDKSDSERARRIADIRKAGLVPLIRVIAKRLTEREALLIEKTLLWKGGRFTDNVSTGNFSAHFRPPHTMHHELPEFDFVNALYYYNVGEGRTRNWDDYSTFGFISAGQGVRWRDAMLNFNPGDVFAAYLKRHGFVGVGKILTPAQMIRDVKIKKKRLLSLPLVSKGMATNSNDEERSEYVCLVEWIQKVSRDDAKWASRLYTTPLVRASLSGQPKTVLFLEQAFGVKLRE